MLPMPIANHDAICAELAESGKYVKVLWQSEDTLMFIARGREYRSEFHINPSDEHMTMLKGTMNLHYRKPDGSEDVCRMTGWRCSAQGRSLRASGRW